MTLKLSETDPGDILLDTESGDVFAVFSLCDKPTATVESVTTGARVGGAIGSPILQPFKPLPAMNETELRRAVRRLAEHAQTSLAERVRLKEELADARLELADWKLKALSSNKHSSDPARSKG